MLRSAPLLRIAFNVRSGLVGSTPWYYWSLVRQTVAVGGTPTQSWEWGTRVPFLDDYPGFTPAVAVFALPGGTSTPAAAHVVEIIAMLSAGIAVFLLVRALGGSRFGGAFATLLFFGADIFANKLLAFRPEAMGYAFALLVPVLVLEYFRTGSRRVLVILGATFVALGLVHGIDWLFGCALLAGAVVAAFPPKESRLASTPADARGDGVGENDGAAAAPVASRAETRALMRADTRAPTRRWLNRVGLVAVGTFGAWAIASVVLGGHLSGASSLGGLPSVEHGVDPSWRFAALAQGSPSAEPPSTMHLVNTSLQRGLRGLGLAWFIGLLVISVGILIAHAWLGPGPRDRSVARHALVFLTVAGAITVIAAVIFIVGWTTYVPRRTGFARLAQVALVLVPIGAGVAVSGFVDATSRRVRRAVVAIACIATFFVVFVFVHGQDRLDGIIEQRPSPATLDALRALPVARTDTVLTNGYSEGLLPVTTGTRGVLTGRAPYADAKLLFRATDLLARAQVFLAAPNADGAQLPCSGIKYLLIDTDGGRSLGMPAAYPTDVAGLDARPDLQLQSLGPGFRLYRVLPPVAPTTYPLDCDAGT